MAATSIGVTGAHLVAGAAAQSVELTQVCREVEVTNLHATQYLVVSVAEGSWAANAAPTTVVGNDDFIVVPPFTSKVVWRNTRVKKLINLNIIASGATTPCYVTGRNWLSS